MIKHKRGRPCIKKPYVYEVVKQRIVAGVYPPGSCIPSTEELADELRMSMFPVHNALVRLKNEGWLERRHGSGTYVSKNTPELRMTDTILLAMNGQGHLFADLSIMLLNRLHNQGKTVMLCDMSHKNAEELFKKILKSDVKTCIIHGLHYFPFKIIPKDALATKNFISILDFDFSNNDVHKILIDHNEGARIVVEWLRSKGIDDVLVLGTDTQITALNSRNSFAMPSAFKKYWSEYGGNILTLVSDNTHSDNVKINEKELISMAKNVRGIFGLRDIEALLAKRALLEYNSALLDEIEFIGYGNTPWSRTEGMAFSSIDWSLEELADRTCELVASLSGNQKPNKPVLMKIAPRLIER
jgi:DNA-binding LacI/PurR family transcriptional regulator